MSGERPADYQVFAGRIAPSEIPFDRREAALRLGVPRDYDDPAAEKSFSEILAAAQPRYCFAAVPVRLTADAADLGFLTVASRDLCRCLSGCRTAFVLACTLGIGIDRLIARLGVTSPAGGFLADALASALAESLADAVSGMLPAGAEALRPRFSPGYGDLPLSVQPAVLSLLGAQKNAGITLNGALLMTPLKSITAIQGVEL